MAGHEEFVGVHDAPPVSPTERVPTDREASTVTSGIRAYVAAVGATPVAVALAVFGMFLPVVVVAYGYSDDYPTLWMAVSGQSNPWFGNSILDAQAVGGRPFAGLLSTAFFKAAGTIENLRFLRLLSVLSIVALALLLQHSLVKSRVRPVFAALVAVLVCAMPAFQVFASWTVLFDATLAALLGAFASVVAVSVATSAQQQVVDRFAASAAMLVAALLIYQPAAMFFWVFLAVALFGAASEPARAVGILRRHAEVAVVALPVAFVLGKLAAHAAHNTSPNAERSHLTHDVIGKVDWFFTHPLYRSLSLFQLTDSPWLAAIVATIAVGGTTIWLLREAARPLLYAVVGLALVPLSFLPNLIVAENNSLVFRTGVALTSLIALYFCLGLYGLWLPVRDWLGSHRGDSATSTAGRAAVATFTVFVAAVAIIAAKNVWTLVVYPQSTELRLIRSDVAALPAGVQNIDYVETAWDQGLTRWYSDELGLASSARPWTPEPLISLLLRQEGRPTPGEGGPAVNLYPFTTTTFPRGDAVIDLRSLQRLR
jgi:hypothetical protein